MNKSELVAAMSVKMESTKKDAEKALQAYLDVVKETAKNGEDIKVTGFGNWEVREVKPRVGRNPKTNEEIQIPGGHKLAFKAGKEIKELFK